MLESKAAIQADFERKSWADRKSRWFSRFKQDSWLRDSITLCVTQSGGLQTTWQPLVSQLYRVNSRSLCNLNYSVMNKLTL